MIIITVILLSAIGVNGKSDCSSSGPSTVRSETQLQLHLESAEGSVLGASGELKYDSSKLTLTSTAQISGSLACRV